MLAVVLPGFAGTGRPHCELPFRRAVPGFFDYLVAARGLRPESILCYRHHLARFEAHVDRIGVADRGAVAGGPQRVRRRALRARLAKATVRESCGVLRVFLRYAHRQRLLAADLSKAVEWPQA